MHEIELSAGPIAYEDTTGPGPVVVLLHGLAMDGSVWSQVVHQLRPDHLCLVPTMPLGDIASRCERMPICQHQGSQNWWPSF